MARRSSSMLFALALLSGCYHFSFEQNPSAARAAERPAPHAMKFTERRPTYLNGFIGTGKVDTTRYCAEPVRTELKVTAADVFLSVVTLLIYTPHTLYVTCPVYDDSLPTAEARRAGSLEGKDL